MSNLKRIIKRSIAIALCAVLIGGSAPSMPAYGIQNDNTVNAVSPASDFAYSINGSNVTITRYIGSASEVVIPSVIEGKHVTDIGFYAFEASSNVKKVVISEGIISIDANAFNGCASLSEIVLPDSLKSIGSNAFSGCTSLSQIIIPGNVEEIGSYAFNACSNLKNVVISDGVQSVGNYCFNACSNLASVTISNTLKTIPSYAFNACFNLTEIRIPEGVQTINPYAFNACFNLEKATVAKSVTKIREYAFDFGNAYQLTIYGTYGSEAERFAAENGYAFVGDGSSESSEIISISLDKTILTLAPGTSASLVATVLPASAGPAVLSWSSSDSTVAIVSDGLVTAVASGTASITVKTTNGKFASCTVIVSNPNEEGNSFTIDRSSVALAKGSTTTLTAVLVVNSSSGNNTVTWNSSNSAVAYISGTSTSTQSSGGYTQTTTDSTGNVTVTYVQGKMTTTSKVTVYAYSAGTAILTATAADGSTQRCTVTVTGNAVYVTNVLLNKTNTSMIKGGTETLTATVYPTNASDQTINWTSSDPAVVTVKDGILTAVSEGSAVITAASPNGPSAACTVNVTSTTVPVTVISLDKTVVSLVEGESITLTPTVYPSNATNKNIAWQSGNSKVATVSGGKVTAVSAGTTTITAKSHNGKTATCSVTVKAPVIAKFEWGRDNWNFINSSYYFGNGTYRSQLNSRYAETLKKNLTNSEYQIIFTGQNAWLDDQWGGSCYGMSSLAYLAQKGYMPFGDYKTGAVKLYDFDNPAYSSDLNSLITYYQMLQVKDVIQQQYRTVKLRSNETNIKEIISLLDSNSTVLICFRKDGWGGHAILAYGYEYGSYRYDGVTYQGRILICDPNYSKSNDSSANIYFNTETYNWTIPAYKANNVSSVYGATFDYIGADIGEINQGGYLSGATENKMAEKSFVARIEANAVSDSRSINKVQNDHGLYSNRSYAGNDILEDYSYVMTGESAGNQGYTLFDPDAAYKVSQEEAVRLDLTMDYENCDMFGYSAAGRSVIFDKDGAKVSITGESADFGIGMVFDEEYNTDWYAISAYGSGANTASLEKYEDGYLLCSDHLSEVKVTANNKNIFREVSFGTEYDKVYIYETTGKRIGLKVDTDGNGSFETDITPHDENAPALLGDINDDEVVDIADALIVARLDAGLIGLDDAHRLSGDVNGDGETDIADALMIARYDAGLITSFSAD